MHVLKSVCDPCSMFPTNWATSGNLSSPPSTQFSTGTMSTSSLYELFLPNNQNQKYQTNIGNIFLNIKFSPTVLLVRQVDIRSLLFPQQLAWSTKGSKGKKCYSRCSFDTGCFLFEFHLHMADKSTDHLIGTQPLHRWWGQTQQPIWPRG